MEVDVQEWAPVAGAALAAVAAAASWRSVAQQRRQWLASQAPSLVGQVYEDEKGGQTALRIQNVGTGSARGVRFCVVVGEQYAAGYAGPNFGGVLGAGEERTVRTQLDSRDGQAAGVLTCLDGADRVHCFTLQGDHKVVPRRGRSVVDGTDPVALFTRCYPSLDLTAREKVTAAALRKQAAR